MIKVLTEKFRSLNPVILKKGDIINKAISRIRSFSLKDICGITAFIYGILLLSLVTVMHLDVGYCVSVNGKNYGFVSTKKEANAILTEALIEIESVKKDFNYENAGYYLGIKSADRMKSSDIVRNEIIADFDGLTSGYAIFVDGEAVVALNNKEEAESLVNELLNSYKTETNQVSFVNNIEIKDSRIKKTLLKNRSDAAAVLTGCHDEAVIHTVSEGETFSQIAENYNISQQTLIDNNLGVTPEKLQIGQKLTVTAPVPLVSVKSIERIQVSEKIPYQVTEKQDSSMYKGIRKVISSGIYGSKNVTYDIVKINNRLEEKIQIDEEIISNPVNEVVAIGTKAKPKTAPTGKFIRPYYGVVTSRYGSRWGRNHNGIDYGGRVGDPVKAADGGTVSFAGWDNGGYGKLIKINHGNGKVTYYAHLNSINVSVGQKVAQGQLIGKVGNTGRSTGPHLHFEIRINGKPVNPSNYVG